MRFERHLPALWLVASIAALSGGCGGFERGEPSPDAGCLPGAGDLGFAADVHPILRDECGTCHSNTGVAGGTRLVLSAAAEDDYGTVEALVDVAAPDDSVLLQKATDSGHGGGAVFGMGSAEYATIRDWIEQGAPLLPGGCTPGGDAAVGDGDAGAGDAGQADAGPQDAGRDGGPEDAGEPDAGPEDAAAPDASGDAAPADGGPPDAAPDAATAPSFAADVYPVLTDDCEVCHREGGPASATALVLTDSASGDYDEVTALIDEAAPESSPLLRKAAGVDHEGGERLATSSDEYALLLEWIGAGAPP